MPRFSLATVALFSMSVLTASPALAQGSGGERINQLIIYGDDPCPASAGEEITVCARKSEAERYRIPEPLRGVGTPQSDAWNNRVMAYETVGKAGTLSCSPVGPGGSTGCVQQMISAAYAERGSDPSVRFGELIAAEREKRMSTIDADAADTQKRVEEEERKYDERRRAAQAQPLPGETTTTPASGQ